MTVGMFVTPSTLSRLPTSENRQVCDVVIDVQLWEVYLQRNEFAFMKPLSLMLLESFHHQNVNATDVCSASNTWH